MEAILKFDGDNPEDITRLERALKANQLYYTLWEMLHNRKKEMLHKISMKDMNGHDAFELFYETLYEELEIHGIDMSTLE